MSRPRPGALRPAPRRGRAVWVWLACALVACAAAAVGVGAWALNRRPAGNPAVVQVSVAKGASAREVVGRLERAGLAPHPELAYWALRADGVFERVQAGVYEIPGDATVREVGAVLAGPPTAQHVTLTLIPGETIWHAARRLERAGLGPPGALEALAADHAFVASLGVPLGPPRAPRTDGFPATYLEGYLYPDTYFFDVDATARDVAVRAATRFGRVWNDVKREHGEAIRALTTRYGLGEADLVTLASLVEREVRAVDESPRVAGVFYNRLARRMTLDTDPTLIYRPDRIGRPPTPTDRRDRSNPYNTYAHRGLPPGPIASPSRAALEAVVRPEAHEFLFFVARRDAEGRHAFARTLAEHEANIDEYLR